jgi:hypothetical protein
MLPRCFVVLLGYVELLEKMSEVATKPRPVGPRHFASQNGAKDMRLQIFGGVTGAFGMSHP